MTRFHFLVGTFVASLFLSLAAAAQIECGLTEAQVTEPQDGATLYIHGGVDAFSLFVEAITDCPDDTARVEFFTQFEGVAAQSAGVDREPPYAAIVEFATNITEEKQLTVSVTASSSTLGTPVARDEIVLTLTPVTAAMDTDENGLPDEPFKVL
ncbi:MAG: hypothetical protein HYZ00_08805, partial [Candidatus Hydrogenedentes bacterium]|nr:hypothetical protein [Candidatus Hydrogenedentota bacterium]